jgi:hypothetical protein
MDEDANQQVEVPPRMSTRLALTVKWINEMFSARKVHHGHTIASPYSILFSHRAPATTVATWHLVGVY